MENRPNGRKTNVTGTGSGLGRKGSVGGGPAGRPGGYSGRTGGGQGGSGAGGGVTRAGGIFKSPILIIIIAAVVLLGGGGGLLGGLLGGDSSSSGGLSNIGNLIQTVVPSLSSLGNGVFTGGSSVSTGWDKDSDNGELDTSVASGSRAKRTVIKGGGADTVTIMVYMCGTDLESKHGMASADMEEMRRATISSKINLIIYTGGCTKWNNGVSSDYNQIYKVADGKITALVAKDGKAAMTTPSTLTKFIKYCADNFPADRNELIMWDHGGGSLSGFGYDEKNKNAGSMSLSGINKALSDSGVKFDFIGFDACLMATLENALMLSQYADYLIGSEETEPGIGWYYTGWLTKLAGNTSMPTTEIGKNIVDDFVSVCGQKYPTAKATLSVVDLAELETAVPDRLKEFAKSTSELISGSEFKKVSDARASTREFSKNIDQVDLVDLAGKIGSSEGSALSDALLGAIKYNRTSSSVTNAYGLSIYFPYQKTGKVSQAVAAYEAIGMDSEYARCIQSFASMETGGQAAGGSASGIGSLLGSLASSSQTTSADGLSSLFGSLLSGSASSALGGLFGKTIDMEAQAEYISQNMIDAKNLVWTGSGSDRRMHLTEEEWSLVHDLLLNVFYDDGEGYLDLGLDNVFSFTPDGDLKGVYDGTWVAVDGHVVAYYYEESLYNADGSYIVKGRIPALVNGERVELIAVFDSSNDYGYIAGAYTDYSDGQTETAAKANYELQSGDVISFIVDAYDYKGNYSDTIELEGTVTFNGSNKVSNVYLPDKSAASAMYVFTDIYNQEYWTPEIGN